MLSFRDPIITIERKKLLNSSGECSFPQLRGAKYFRNAEI